MFQSYSAVSFENNNNEKSFFFVSTYDSSLFVFDYVALSAVHLSSSLATIQRVVERLGRICHKKLMTLLKFLLIYNVFSHLNSLI